MRMIGILVILAALLISGCTAGIQAAQNSDKAMEGDKTMDNSMEDTTMEKDTAMMDKGAMSDSMEDDNKTEDTMMNKDTDAMEGDDKTDTMMEKDTTMMTEDSKVMFSGNVLAGKTSQYIEFNKADYDKALAEGKTVLLYFYANWCPTCKAEQPMIREAFDSLDNDDVVAFRVNYKDPDTDADEEALARQYGIAYQHTKVIIQDGQQVLKSPEDWTTQRYLDEVAKYTG